MDVDAMWQVLFCLMQHEAEEDGQQCRSQDALCLTPLQMGKLPELPIVLHLTLLTFMELVADGEKFGETTKTPGFSTVHHG